MVQASQQSRQGHPSCNRPSDIRINIRPDSFQCKEAGLTFSLGVFEFAAFDGPASEFVFSILGPASALFSSSSATTSSLRLHVFNGRVEIP